MLTAIDYRERGFVWLRSDDGQTKRVPRADYDADRDSHKTGAFAPAPLAPPTAEERLAALEAELQAMADPYAAAWEGAKGGIARWAAIERLLVAKSIMTEQEITDMAATLEVDGAGVVTSVGA